MEIKILGTVAPHCQDGKNCPGYLITMENHKILLDCGNGITNLLNLEEDLENMTIIISHLHPDHYGDLLSIAQSVDLYHKFGFLNKKVNLYLPPATIEVRKEHEDWGCSRKPKEASIDDIFVRGIIEGHYFKSHQYDENTTLQIGNSKISFFKTIHPKNTYAVKVEDKTGVVVYSTDTGYEQGEFINFIQDANIFLCESTFLRGQVRETNHHLYAYEAAKLADMAHVDLLVLTHFWPGIERDLYVQEALGYFPNTIAAEEGKIIKLTK